MMQRTRATIILASILSALVLASCAYNVRGTPTYEDSGVKRLIYKNLGLHSWGFHRPSFSEPTIADIWDALSEKVTALGGMRALSDMKELDG